LTPQQQKWLQKAADDSSAFQRELWAKKTKEYLDSAEEELGVTVYYPDQNLFKEKCLPLLESYEGTEIGFLLKRIDEVR
jgi:TRAP-type C4-dicarboxylate transport system substrate-binding protein